MMQMKRQVQRSAIWTILCAMLLQLVFAGSWQQRAYATESQAAGNPASAPKAEVVEKLINGFESAAFWGSADKIAVTEHTQGAKAVKVTYSSSDSNEYIALGDSATVDVTGAIALKFDIWPESQTAGATELVRVKLMDTASNTVYYDGSFATVKAGQWNTVTVYPHTAPGKVNQIQFYALKGDAEWESRTSVTYTIDNLRAVIPTVDMLISGLEDSAKLGYYGAVTAAVYAEHSEGAGSLKVGFTKTSIQWNGATYSTGGVDVSKALAFKFDIYPETQTTGALELAKAKLVDSGGKTISDAAFTTVPAGQWSTVTISPGASAAASSGLLGRFELYVDNTNALWGDRLTASYRVDNLRMVVPLATAESLINGFDDVSQFTTYGGVLKAPADSHTEGIGALSVTYSADGSEWQGMAYDRQGVDVSGALAFKFDIYPESQTTGAREPIHLKLVDENGSTVYYEEYATDTKGIQALPAHQWSTVLVYPRSGVAVGKVKKIDLYVHNAVKRAQNPLTATQVWEDRPTVTYKIDNLRAVVPASSIVIKPLKLELASSQPGNIFTTEQIPSITVKLNNITAAALPVNLAYSVRDYSGREVYNLTELVPVPSGGPVELNKPIPVSLNGVYTLTVHATTEDGAVDETVTTSFSKVLPLIADRSNGKLGVQTHFPSNKGDPKINIPIAALGGARFIRDEMFWASAEKTKGTVTVDPKWEAYVNETIANGMEPLIELNFGNSFYDGGGIPYTEEGIAAFVNYAKTIVSHFEGKVKYFELWNEPDAPAGTFFNPTGRTATDYANLAKAVYPAIKEVNPDAVLMIGSTIGVDIPWLKEVFDDGGYDYADAISVHPYSWPNGPEAGNLLLKISSLQDLMRQYSGSANAVKPIWFTEIGWPTHTEDAGVSELTSASFLVRAYTLAMSTGAVSKMLWYDLQDDGSNPAEPEDRFGLIRYQSDEEAPNAAKLGYVALNALTHQLNGAEFVSKYSTDSNMYLYKYHRSADNKDVLVAWNLYSTKTVGLQVGDGDFKVTDIFGNSQIQSAVNGVITATLNDTPIYIEGVIGNVAAGTPDFAPLADTVYALSGHTFQLGIKRTANGVSLSGKVEVQLPEGWALISDSAFTPGSEPIVLTVSVPGGVEKKLYDVNIKLLSADNTVTYADLKAKVNVTDPVQVKITPMSVVPVTESKWKLAMELSNITDTPFHGTLTVEEPTTGWASDLGPISFGDIAGGSSRVIEIPVNNPDQKLVELKLRVDLSNGYSAEISRKTSFLAAAKNTGTITADGVLNASEWGATSHFDLGTAEQYIKLKEDWGGPDDLSAQGFVQWDANNLYLAMEATDDLQYQTAAGSDIWQGDGMQFTFDPYRTNGPSSPGNNHEIGVALSTGGVEKWRWTATAGKQSGPISNMSFAVKRDEVTKKTIYEAVIPWSELLENGVAPADGKLYGFALVLNDNDGAGRSGYLEYMSGIGNAKDPGLYGDLVLAPGLVPADPGNGNQNQGDENEGNQNQSNPNSGNTTGSNNSTFGQVQVDKITVEAGKATATVLDSAIVAAWKQADSVQIDIPKADDAHAYAVLLPARLLSAGNGAQKIVLKTELGVITLPANLLTEAETAGASQVSVEIAAAGDEDGLAAETKAQIDGRPAVDLQLKVDGAVKEWNNPDALVTVLIPYTPAAEERTDSDHIVVLYLDGNGNVTPVPTGKYDAASGGVLFTTTRFSKYAVAFVHRTFADLSGHAWASKAIEALASRRIIEGVSAEDFEPGNNVTRADFVLMLMKALGLAAKTEGGSFADVADTAYYAEAVSAAKARGITDGVDHNRFNPEAAITRQDMMTLISRALAIANKQLAPGTEEDLKQFSDQQDIAFYARSSVSALVKSGIVIGDSFGVNPLGHASRAETAMMIYRMYKQ